MAEYSDKKCGQCVHWHKAPTDPNNLAAPPTGECRQSLRTVAVPTMIVKARDLQGNDFLQCVQPEYQSLYAMNIPADFRACSNFQYEPRIQLV